MDLVEQKAVAELGAALRELAPQGADRVVFHLVHTSTRRPIRDVCVAPFRADDWVARRSRPFGEPGAEESLGEAVRTGCVDVPDAGPVRRVEQLMSALLHKLDRSVVTQVGGSAQAEGGGGGGGAR